MPPAHPPACPPPYAERPVRVRPCPCPYCRRLTSTSHESASIHRRLVCVVGLCWPWPWVQVHELILVLTTLLCVCCEICTIHASFPCSVYFFFLSFASCVVFCTSPRRDSLFLENVPIPCSSLLFRSYAPPKPSPHEGSPFLRSPTLLPVFTMLYRI